MYDSRGLRDEQRAESRFGKRQRRLNRLSSAKETPVTSCYTSICIWIGLAAQEVALSILLQRPAGHLNQGSSAYCIKSFEVKGQISRHSSYETLTVGH
ncbi:hypothetical protein Ac2012v2_005088 [Leucoagaricus gongylophorus]